MAKMGGPWIPVPEEVIYLLEQETPVCMVAYILMLAHFNIEEVHKTDGIWVAGRIHATRHKIAERVAKSRSHFNETIWPAWERQELATRKDGGVYLPKLFKKGDSFFQPQVMKREIEELKLSQLQNERKSKEMTRTIEKLMTALSEMTTLAQVSENLTPTNELRKVKATIPICHSTDSDLSQIAFSTVTDRPLSLLSLKDLKISLSHMNALVTKFYTTIGTKRVSKPVRDKAIASFQKLLEEGYLPGEIAYALEWIPENAKEDIEHFGIVPHMIAQALKAGKAMQAEEETKKEKEEERRKADESRITEDQEVEILKKYKEELPEERREKLREGAMEQLRNTPGIKSDFMSEALIEVIENEILRSAGVLLPPEEV